MRDDIYVFGDSLAVGWPALIDVPEANVMIEGGSRMVDDWTPGGSGGLWWNRYIDSTQLDYRTVIVSLGFNDLRLTEPPGSSTGVPAWALGVHVEAFASEMRDYNVARLLWCVPPGSPATHQHRTCADAYMAVFEALERETILERVDFWRYMGREHFGDENGGGDVVHMNQKGQRHAARLVRAVLEK